MFTRAFYKLMEVRFGGLSSETFLAVDGLTNTVFGTAIDPFTTLLRNDNYYYSMNLYKLIKDYAGSGGGVYLGDGTDEPTMDDYRLSGNVINTFDYLNTVTLASKVDENVIEHSATYTITNTGTKAFTVSEIALIGNASKETNSGLAKHKCLFERTLLDNPVTIEPGGVGKVTYTIRMNRFQTA